MKPIRSESVFSTPWFDVVAKTMRDGELPYYSLRMPDYTAVLALTAEGRVVAVRQYRPALETYTLELPSGLVDPGESPAGAARRELFEETGYRASELQLIGEMSTDVGRLSNRIWSYFACGVRKDEAAQPEAGIEAVTLSIEELREMLIGGQFNHALHVAILTLAAARNLIAIS
ncbi:MAG TPA: NUDIX hydrolase [Bryobacteraceae bacterium]|jgi:ADP-ribose pyrophosphatase|nr:NUDIX hydrolase [Bryobacteraceae bacterium]